MAACLLIHDMKMQMLFLASELPHSFTTSSSLGVADCAQLCTAIQACTHLDALLIHCPYCCFRCQRMRSAAVPGAHSFSTRKREELEAFRNRSVAALHFYGPVHKTACVPGFCSVWGCHAVSREGPFEARPMALDKWHPRSVPPLVLLEKQGQTLLTRTLKHFTILTFPK